MSALRRHSVQASAHWKTKTAVGNYSTEVDENYCLYLEIAFRFCFIKPKKMPENLQNQISFEWSESFHFSFHQEELEFIFFFSTGGSIIYIFNVSTDEK